MILNKENGFFIAEVGQNHQGDLDMAREFIRIFAFEGANAVKFQTRNNKYLFSNEAYEAPYSSENAFAETYGAHREKLELKPEWLPILKADCEKHGVMFMSTPFDEPSLNLLNEIGVDILKVASFDIGNLAFINRIASTGKPVVMSIGGGQLDQIRSSVETILTHHNNLALLHCVSEYPCPVDRLGLDNIETLAKEFPTCLIGSSDHFNGILSGPIAFMKGARVFEKHVTLNRASKGTDHSFALEPDGFRKFVRDTKRVSQMLPPKTKDSLGQEAVFKKLGKSVVALFDIKANEKISLDNISGRIFTKQYIPVREINKILGKTLKRDIKQGEAILLSDLVND